MDEQLAALGQARNDGHVEDICQTHGTASVGECPRAIRSPLLVTVTRPT